MSPTDRSGPPGAAEADPSLASTVDRLRDELEGLRLAMRTRAAIEQAKGMLMERHGCTPDEAFDRLARLSQHANVKLADVAAALVDASQAAPAIAQDAADRPLPRTTASPLAVARAIRQQELTRWPRQGSGDGEFGTRLRLRARRTRARSELLAAEQPRDVLDAVVRTALADAPPRAAALAQVDQNGALVLLASHGIPAAPAARWRRVPIELELPVCAVARTGTSRWLRAADGQEVELGLGLPTDWTLAALLTHDGDSARTVLALLWDGPNAPAAREQSAVEQIAVVATAAVRRVLRAGSSAPASADPGPSDALGPGDPAVALLDVMFEPVLLGEPVLGPEDALADLLLLHANPATVDPAGRTPAELVGRSLLELYPDATRSGLLDACRRVHREGIQLDLPDQPWRSTVAGQQHEVVADTRVSRYGAGIMITWSARPRPGAPAAEGIA